MAGISAVVTATILYPIARFLVPPRSSAPAVNLVEAAAASDVEPNSGKIYRFGAKPALLIRTPGGELRSFTAVCTHLDCTVKYRSDLQHIWCACHNGHYDLRGRNISGPPPRPLEEYRVQVKDEKVFVARS